jgi:hypothetical protein
MPYALLNPVINTVYRYLSGDQSYRIPYLF